MTSSLSRDPPKAAEHPKLALLGAAGALDLASHLRRVSANLLDGEPAPDATSVGLAMRHGYQRLSARTGDVGSLRALLQILRLARTSGLPANWVWRGMDGRVFDGLRPEVDPDGAADAKELAFLRQAHHKALMDLLAGAEVLILMLSGAGSLVDVQDGTVYPFQPGTAARPPAKVKLVHDLGDMQSLNADFDALYGLLSEINPRLMLRLALVPAAVETADFTARLPVLRHQSDLRVLMAHWAATKPRVSYLPLWELCTGHLAQAGQYSPQSGHLTPEGGLQVAWLCLGQDVAAAGAGRLPEASADEAAAALAKKRARRAQRRADRAAKGGSAKSVICEDELLEAFSK